MKNARGECKAVRFFLLRLIVLGLMGWTAAGLQAGPGIQSAPSTPHESLESILKDLAVYNFAVGVGAPMRLKAYVLTLKDDPAGRKETEMKLLSFLESGATRGGKMEACRSLRLIGSAAAVPVLGRILLKPETADMARYALERIPGPEAATALLSALDKTHGPVKLGIVFSLGERSDVAVPALERLARGKAPDMASAAVKSLGRIGGDDASKALTALLARSVKDPLKSEVLSAKLAVAEGYLRDGWKSKAAAIYDQVLASNPSPVPRRAAFKGKIASSDGEAKELILKALGGSDPALHDPAIAMVPEIFEPGDIGLISPYLSMLPEAGKIQLLAVLGGYPGNKVMPDIVAACENSSTPVRLEALRSLGKVGDASVVSLLARRAVLTKGVEQAAAREALWRLKGPDVDEAFLNSLTTADDEGLKIELIRGAGERRIAGAKPFLVKAIKSGPTAVRLGATRSLRDIASQADIGILLDLLFTLEDETAREEMQNTVAAVARKNPRELARGNEAEALLPRENDPRKKVDILRVLGKIGDDTALPLIRGALSDADSSVIDAAVRALADWPTVSARDDVYETARTSIIMTHRVLSLRAYVRMIGLEPHRQPAGAVADLQKALAVSPRPEEKKLILGMLPRFPCVSGLKTAESLIADRAVKEEAKLAADRIRTTLADRR